MNKFEKLLCWLGFDIVIDIEPHFENQRIVQRGKKQTLQKLTESTYAYDAEWVDIKEL